MKAITGLALVGRSIFGVTKLIGHLTLIVPGLWFSRSCGVRRFRGELRRLGLEDQVVAALTREYRDMGRLRNWVLNSRG